MLEEIPGPHGKIAGINLLQRFGAAGFEYPTQNLAQKDHKPIQDTPSL